MHRTLAFIALTALAGPTANAAIVLNFESSSGLSASTYVESGFQFDVAPGSISLFSTPVMGGSQAIGINDSNNANTVTLTQVGGGLFSFNSIDITTLAAGGPTALTFSANGGAFTTMITLPVGPSTQSFTITDPNFDSITSVSWNQTTPAHVFDNVSVTAVPEPSSALLLVGGMAACGLRRRRR